MASLPIHGDDSANLELLVKVEPPQFTQKAVKEAGKLLRHRLEAADDDVVRAFQVAHNWRNAHILPMRKMRADLSVKARRCNPAIVTAGRLKRMKSIRKKLSRLPYNLWQMQDIGGCRAIMDSIGDVQRVIDSYAQGARHTLVSANDYVNEPKRGGYRSHHQVYMFAGQGDEEAYKHQMIEVQIRTQLQHAWATAVEAVGLVRNEDLKGGEGDGDWLRFFELMSSEFADEEGCAVVPGTPDSATERRLEIKDLNAKLRAMNNLRSYVRVIDATAGAYAGKGQIFLIQYDPSLMQVSASAFASYQAGYTRYEAAESRESGVDTVLVEVDKADDLRAAYPNYFLDVGMFVERLGKIVTPPVKPKNEPRPVKIDLTWWTRGHRRGRKPAV